MKTRTFNTLKAVKLLNELGGGRVTVGEVARWTNQSYSTAKRNLMKLRQWQLVDYEVFTFASRDCRDWFETDMGVAIYEEWQELPLGGAK